MRRRGQAVRPTRGLQVWRSGKLAARWAVPLRWSMAGSSCSTGTAAAHAARRLSLASVKQQPELTEEASGGSDVEETGQSPQRKRPRTGPSSKLHKEAGKPMQHAGCKVPKDVASLAGSAHHKSGGHCSGLPSDRAAAAQAAVEAMLPLFKDAQRGRRSRHGGSASARRNSGGGGGGDGHFDQTRDVGKAAGSTPGAAAIQETDDPRAQHSALAPKCARHCGELSVLGGASMAEEEWVAIRPSRQQQWLASQSDPLFSPQQSRLRRPDFNAKEQQLPITPLRPLPPPCSKAAASAHAGSLQGMLSEHGCRTGLCSAPPAVPACAPTCQDHHRKGPAWTHCSPWPLLSLHRLKPGASPL